MHAAEEDEIKAYVRDFDLTPVTKKYARQASISDEEALRLTHEIKRFFVLRAIFKIKYGLRGRIDDLFHVFILNTRLYHEFCERVFGQYLHHSPADDDIKSENEGVAYIRLLIDYFRHFGEHPPHDIWPLSAELFGSVPEWEMPRGECVAPCVEV